MSAERFEPVKVGVVGLGGFGRLHALTLLGLAEAELVAVVDRQAAQLQAFTDHAPHVPGWLDVEDALRESDAEAWIVASASHSHVPVATRLLKAGKPVLIEKPIALDLHEAERLALLVEGDSSNLMLGHVLLFNSEFRQLNSELRHGPHGDRRIHFINAVRHRPISTLEMYPGESPFHLSMIHDLYCVLAMTGRAEPTGFTAHTHRNDDGQIDLTLAQLVWDDGCIASLAASFMTSPGMGDDGFDRMEVFGDGWVARVTPNPRPIAWFEEKARWPMPLEICADERGASGMLAEEQRCFCRVVRGEQAVPMGATYQDALQVQRWLDRLEQAAESTHVER